MRVKRYIVDTMPDAMLKIRADLGSDAVILSTKELKTGGFLGMFQKKQIEVIAAVDKGQAAETPAAPPARTEQAPLPTMPVPPRAVPDAYRKSSQAFAESMRQPADSVAHESISAPRATSNQAEANAPFQARDLQEPNALQQYATRFTETKQPENEQQLSEENLLEELRQMKQMMAELSREKKIIDLPKSLQQLQAHLKAQGVEQSLIDGWLEAIVQQAPKSTQMTLPKAKRAMREQIERFTAQRIGGGINPSTKIVYVAGPTGVGKTTTIAKLAAEQLFKYKRKVGFVTSDTYRISAVEQLRTYASILSVPLEIVQSPGDFQRALEQMSDCDLILMDTAGRNYRNELLVSELQSLLAPMEQSETYLVLSLTSKTEDMRIITNHFNKYPLDKVIFTKADETGSYGAMFNMLQEYPLRLSYMTNGQNVPDDLLMPSPDFLAGVLLGEVLP
ncbi:flagellar biosynthesis protein FlhF [Paenibacillus sp. SGZ-1009]|uniref:flagellar biosynthesis protein FlhF n=1 Tax=Paenibacillus campi TaxID=3106031 RepID=UPI002B00229A|nr:flagellar biosynthesis protein FlhF [Paenibacillus sp. SGZ-1009]